LFAASPQALYGWRRFLLRLFGAKVGKGVMIRPSVRVVYPWKLEICDYAWIGDRVELYTLETIKIGAHSVISQDSYICTGTHDYLDPSFAIKALPITIGAEAWLASQVFVCPGVTIGRGAVIGARSLVLSDIPPMMVAHGHPAKIAGKRILDPDGRSFKIDDTDHPTCSNTGSKAQPPTRS
jgi:putative colanic acid biosynthesis acetyltransferase WcaF